MNYYMNALYDYMHYYMNAHEHTHTHTHTHTHIYLQDSCITVIRESYVILQKRN